MIGHQVNGMRGLERDAKRWLSGRRRHELEPAPARKLQQERERPPCANYYFSDKSVIICGPKYDWTNLLLTGLVCRGEPDSSTILTPSKQEPQKKNNNNNNELEEFVGEPASSNRGMKTGNKVALNRQTERISHHEHDKISKNLAEVKNVSIAKPLLVLLALLALSQQPQNAVHCFWPGTSQRPDNFSLASYYNPHQSPMIPTNNHNSARSFNWGRSLDQIMPSHPNNMDSSLLNDPAANVPSSANGNDPLQGWPSILPSILNPTTNQHHQQTPDTLDKHVRNILVPRVSGTKGNQRVRDYIVSSLEANNYHVELDEFTDSTPIGQVKFANIIADSNPNACRQLVIACHYDSKLMEGFLGAIDSAVPCAMLLKMSETFNKSFRASDGEASDDDDQSKDSLGLRFIFFDGEEAFENWSSTDSLYGSRHLAEKWEQTKAPINCGHLKNELKRIELFLILDLIGSADTTFVMYNRDLKHHYNNMIKYEKDYLARSGVRSTNMRPLTAFKNRFIPIHVVEDDHTPFLKRGVPILSLLAHPFPQVWHQVSDNYEAIDFQRTRRILHVLEEFVSNYKK